MGSDFFRRAMACAAGLAAFALPLPAFATPATESDFRDIRNGVFNVNATASYESSHVFRGVRQADDVTALQLKTSLKTGLVDLAAGAKAFRPLQDQNAGIDEPTEVNLFVSGRVDVLGLITAEAGATYYHYADGEDTGADPDSFEIYGGLDLPIILPVLVRAYYDVDYENLTVETKSHWRQPILGNKLAIELSSVLGYVHQGDEGANENAALAGARSLVESDADVNDLDAKDNRFYYGVGAALGSRITQNVQLNAHVNWAGTTGEFNFDGDQDDETLWGGASVTVGF